MTTFVYSRNGCKPPLREDGIHSALCTDESPIHYLSEEGDGRPGEGLRRPCLESLLDMMGSGDALIVNRLEDLGNDAQEIRLTISLLLQRTPRVYVFRHDASDCASPAGGSLRNALDALAEKEGQVVNAFGETDRARPSRRCVKIAPPLRSAIVTNYSLGESISSLARRYELPRSTVARLVRPERPGESSLPFAFGD